MIAGHMSDKNHKKSNRRRGTGTLPVRAAFLFLLAVLASGPHAVFAQQTSDEQTASGAQDGGTADSTEPQFYDFIRNIPILTPPYSGDVRKLIGQAFGPVIDRLAFENDKTPEDIIEERVWVKFADLDLDDAHPAKEILIFFSGGEACEVAGACTGIYRFGLNKWRPVLSVAGLANISRTHAGGMRQIIVTGTGTRHPLMSFDGRSFKFTKTIDSGQLMTVAEAREREAAARLAQVVTTPGSADWSFGQNDEDYPLVIKGYGKVGFVLQCLGLANGYQAGLVTPECAPSGDVLTFETSTRRRFEVAVTPRGKGICSGSISYAEATYIGKANTLTVTFSPAIARAAGANSLTVDLKGSLRSLNRLAAEGGCRWIR